jgi:hypothetical protein
MHMIDSMTGTIKCAAITYGLAVIEPVNVSHTAKRDGRGDFDTCASVDETGTA